MIFLITIFCFGGVYADEPLWTEKEREIKRDIVIEGKVLKVDKLHKLKNYKWIEVWSADIKVSAVQKGSEKLKGQTITVLFERGTIIDGTKIRNKRCPQCADLNKGDKYKFFIVKCTKAHLKKLEMKKNTKDILFIEMGSDIVKLISPKEKGIMRAKKDITANRMKILYYGKPWSHGKPLIDDESGLPVEIVAGCCVRPEFVEETGAYNKTMRQEIKDKQANQKLRKQNH